MGLVIPQTIELELGGSLFRYYENKGYEIPKILDKYNKPKFILGTKISVDILDLSPKSDCFVDVQCDFCNTIYQLRYRALVIRKSDKCCCKDCMKHMKKTKDENGIVQFEKIPYRDKEWLYEEYIIKNREASDIAYECGIYPRTLREWFNKLNVGLKYDILLEPITKEILFDLYINREKTTEEIAQMFNTTGNTISKLLKEYDIGVYERSYLTKRYLHQKGGVEKIKENSRKLENRIATSCRIKGIPIEDFAGFYKTNTELIRTSCDYDNWRMDVFRRDWFTCQCCGHKSGKLNAHHIENFLDNPDKRFDIDNGITLCEKCHLIKYPNSFHKIYGQKNNTKEQLDEYINNYKLQTEVS